VRTSSRHPMARGYPAGAFLQPGFFIWDRSGRCLHEWRSAAGLRSLYGAAGRPTPAAMLQTIRRCLAPGREGGDPWVR